MTKKEMFKELDGCEVWSIQFEDCVGINAQTQTIHRCNIGDTIKPTATQMKELWEEYFEAEFGTRDVNALLKAEFGI